MIFQVAVCKFLGQNCFSSPPIGFKFLRCLVTHEEEFISCFEPIMKTDNPCFLRLGDRKTQQMSFPCTRQYKCEYVKESTLPKDETSKENKAITKTTTENESEDTTPIVTTPEITTSEAPTIEVPKTEAPTTLDTTPIVTTPEITTIQAPTIEVPTTEAPTTLDTTPIVTTPEITTIEAPTIEVPTTEAPTTEAFPTVDSTTEATSTATTTMTPKQDKTMIIFSTSAALMIVIILVIFIYIKCRKSHKRCKNAESQVELELKEAMEN